jgi:ubiquitin carboxyl-terminal hydrolase 36/42
MFDGKLISLYNDFLCLYNKSKNNFSPSMIVKYVSNELGRIGSRQEDAEQYLNYIIDTLIDELKESCKKGEYKILHKNLPIETVITNLFTIKVKKIVSCPMCDYKTVSNDDINKLYLSFNKDAQEQNLNSLLNEYLYEILDDDNKWKCDRCKHYVNAHIRREIIKLPKYLIIALKRYDNHNHKIETTVTIDDEFMFKNNNFYLRGIIYHSGTTSGGHYMYYGKGDDEWNLYNDSSVQKTSSIDVDRIIKNGYIYLFVNK